MKDPQGRINADGELMLHISTEVTEAMYQQVQDYRFEHRHKTLSDALRELIDAALRISSPL